MYKYRKKGEKSSASIKNTKIVADFSSLRKPVDTSASDLYQVCKLLEKGTDEVKSILSYESNIIYECRKCLSLFRSIINLISHKRFYCTEKFNVTQKVANKHNLNSFKRTTIHMSETGQTKIEEIEENGRLLRSQVSKEVEKRTDLSSIIERLNKKIQETQCNSSSELTQEHSHLSSEDRSNENKIYLKPISTTSLAVYQTIKPEDETIDLLNEETAAKVEHFRNQQVDAISQEQIFDNQVEKSDNPIQADMSDEENKLLAYRLSSVNTLACSICNAKFSSKKTLTFHMKSLHASKRKCYSCPFCRSTFTNIWSVYRHLSKVHKKTNKQVRNLKPQIQLAVFHKNTNAEKQYRAAKKKKTCETLKNMNDNESQKDDALSHVEKSNVKRTGKASRKNIKNTSVYLQYHNNHHSKNNSNLADTSRMQDDDKPVIIEKVLFEEKMNVKDVILEDMIDGFLETSDKSSDSSCARETNLPQLDEIKETNSLTDVKVDSVENFNSSNSDKSSDIDLLQPDEKEETSQMDTKMASIANFKRLKCLKCNRKLTSLANLRRHIAIHLDWFRYRCKLCHFQSFARCDCKTHFAKHHRTVENNNANPEVMIEKIPWNEYVSSDDAITNLMNERERLNNTGGVANASSEEEKTDESVVTDVSSSNSEIRTDSNNSSDSNAPNASHESTSEEITDSHCNDSDDDKKFTTAYTTAMIENLKEYMMSHDPGKSNKNLDHSDLKQMVMEMIVGSDDSDPTSVKKSDSEKLASQANNDMFKHRISAKDTNNVSANKSKEANLRSDLRFKHQRPMRNRVRPLSDDFIYDLKEIQVKRECAFPNDSEPSARKKAKWHKLQI
ncbi:zinc finger protein 800 [Pseudomyrmex gracilis]|uniref:zinc finger protein 800 n=1 Tax=Pseudomyrmex gracilis TaxID=219809 RepID=UPI000995AD83|nr:zinc finger protein 800 [Pseudomyrmex gracilis]XP_020281414.1 zinc finger protein 800 [Pseudomyrmex gracilis]XP_020281415.1 zinc finger protein 800 [Pseudomyrmex gracilis]